MLAGLILHRHPGEAVTQRIPDMGIASLPAPFYVLAWGAVTLAGLVVTAMCTDLT